MRRLITGISVLAIAGVSIAFLLHRSAKDTTSYRFVEVTRGDIESAVNSTGILSAVRTVQVGTQVSGQIAELHADFNDHVKKGQLIARLDPTVLEEAVRQAEADVERAQADLQQKQFVLNQTESMYKNEVSTETEYKTAQYDAKMSEAALKSSQSNLERAKRNLSYASIYSPIDGIVIERNVDVGQTVAASLSAPQLFLIAEDLSHMQILASVDEGDIGQIREGQPVHFTVQAYPNRTFDGKVGQVRMQSTANENVVNYTVVVAVNNPDGLLLPGMTATVSFEVAKATNVLKVQNAALRLRPTAAMIATARTGGPAGLRDSSRAGTDSGRGIARRPGTVEEDALREPGRAGGVGESQRVGFAQLWYLDDNGNPAMTRVRTGLTNGQETEITGSSVHEGMQVIAAVTSSDQAPGAVSSPFQTGQPQGRGGFRGRGGF